MAKLSRRARELFDAIVEDEKLPYGIFKMTQSTIEDLKVKGFNPSEIQNLFYELKSKGWAFRDESYWLDIPEGEL